MNAKNSSAENFSRALANLKRSLATPITEPRDQSGIIKDFEMTYELSWKAMKKMLLNQGHQTLGAKDVFSKAFQLGFLAEEGPWLAMIEDRNLTSHVYDEEAAMQIINRVRTKYLDLFTELQAKYFKDSPSA